MYSGKEANLSILQREGGSQEDVLQSVGAPSRPVWSAVGLDPIPSCMAAHYYSGSSDNNICFRTGVAIINPLFNEYI